MMKKYVLLPLLLILILGVGCLFGNVYAMNMITEERADILTELNHHSVNSIFHRAIREDNQYYISFLLNLPAYNRPDQQTIDDGYEIIVDQAIDYYDYERDEMKFPESAKLLLPYLSQDMIHDLFLGAVEQKNYQMIIFLFNQVDLNQETIDDTYNNTMINLDNCTGDLEGDRAPLDAIVEFLYPHVSEDELYYWAQSEGSDEEGQEGIFLLSYMMTTQFLYRIYH